VTSWTTRLRLQWFTSIWRYINFITYLLTYLYDCHVVRCVMGWKSWGQEVAIFLPTAANFRQQLTIKNYKDFQSKLSYCMPKKIIWDLLIRYICPHKVFYFKMHSDATFLCSIQPFFSIWWQKFPSCRCFFEEYLSTRWKFSDRLKFMECRYPLPPSTTPLMAKVWLCTIRHWII